MQISLSSLQQNTCAFNSEILVTLPCHDEARKYANNTETQVKDEGAAYHGQFPQQKHLSCSVGHPFIENLVT